MLASLISASRRSRSASFPFCPFRLSYMRALCMAMAACSPKLRASSISSVVYDRSRCVSLITSMPSVLPWNRNGTLRHVFSPHFSMDFRTSGANKGSEMVSTTGSSLSRTSRSDGYSDNDTGSCRSANPSGSSW